MDSKPPKLSLFDSSMLVMGAILGVGIFFNPSQVAGLVQSVPAYYSAWGIGCLVALCGAFTFAEWAATFPHAGGSFVYLREVYGRPVAFLLAWVVLFVISTAALSVMTDYGASWIGDVLPDPDLIGPVGSVSHSLLSGGIIVSLTLLALGGAKVGATFQNACMLVKLVLAITLVVFGLVLFVPDSAVLEIATAQAPTVEPIPIWRGMILAMLPVLFACGGWPLVAYIATEIRDPERNLPRAFILGVLGVTILYLGLNWSFIRVVGIDYLASNPFFISEVVQRTLGATAGKFVSLALAISAIGVCTVTVITTPWLYVAMAREKLFFKGFAKLHPRTGAPVLGLFLQCILALGYMLFGDTNFLVDSVVFVEWIFHVLIAFGLLWIRAKRPELPRPFRSFAYPLMPLIYGLFATGLVIGVIWQADAAKTLTGLAVFASGALVYPFWQRMITRRES
ncbi:MAG: APA family basic amino acid/polyamine antiporter [Planctomycetota bacterium]|jgi:APA family basic amino acid/polyamine antiporter